MKSCMAGTPERPSPWGIAQCSLQSAGNLWTPRSNLPVQKLICSVVVTDVSISFSMDSSPKSLYRSNKSAVRNPRNKIQSCWFSQQFPTWVMQLEQSHKSKHLNSCYLESQRILYVVFDASRAKDKVRRKIARFQKAQVQRNSSHKMPFG